MFLGADSDGDTGAMNPPRAGLTVKQAEAKAERLLQKTLEASESSDEAHRRALSYATMFLTPIVSSWRRECPICGKVTLWHFSAFDVKPQWACGTDGCKAILETTGF